MIRLSNEQELTAFFEDTQLAMICNYLETDCEGCTELLSVFAEIASEPAYNEIKFGVMEAQPGSIAENLVKQRQVPFVAIYKNGEMINCASVNSEKEFRKMLRRF